MVFLQSITITTLRCNLVEPCLSTVMESLRSGAFGMESITCMSLLACTGHFGGFHQPMLDYSMINILQLLIKRRRRLLVLHLVRNVANTHVSSTELDLNASERVCIHPASSAKTPRVFHDSLKLRYYIQFTL